jgi:hypothetical protein
MNAIENDIMNQYFSSKKMNNNDGGCCSVIFFVLAIIGALALLGMLR